MGIQAFHPTWHVTRVGINDVSATLGLSHRAIRHYEEKGLLDVPRDHLNRRCYTPEARLRLELISALRRAGLSIPDIRAVLEVDAPAVARQVAAGKLQRRRQELLQGLREVEAAQDRLASLAAWGPGPQERRPRALAAAGGGR